MEGERQTILPFYGKLPEGWESTTLFNLTDRIGDGLHGTPKYVDESEYYFINGNNLVNGSVVLSDNTKKVSEEEYLKHKKDINLNTLLLSINGTIGNLAKYNGEQVMLGKSAAYLNCKSDYTNFLFHLLQSEFNQAYFKSTLTGSTIKNLSLQSIRETPVPLPPIPEQQKIAAILCKWDELIEQQTQLIAAKEKRKKGLMQKLLTGEIRFPGFSEEWELTELGKIGQVVNGLTYSPLDIEPSGTLVLRSSNVQNRTLAFKDNVFVNVENLKFNPVKENDILICIRNGSKNLIGKNAIIGKEQEGMAFGAFMSVFRSSINEFLYHVFDTDYYKKEVYRNLGATINSINGSDFRRFKMPIPSTDEMNKITEFMNSIQLEIEGMKDELNKLENQKKGLMQQLLTGKIRVSDC